MLAHINNNLWLFYGDCRGSALLNLQENNCSIIPQTMITQHISNRLKPFTVTVAVLLCYST